MTTDTTYPGGRPGDAGAADGSGDDGPFFCPGLPATVQVVANRAAHCHDDRAVLAIADDLAGNVTYRWYKDGAALTDDARLTGSAGATLSIGSFGASDAGAYSVTVSDACGTTAQSAARALAFVDPCIERDASGHFLTYRGRPLLAIGDSGTQVVLQNRNVDYRKWVDDLADRGMSALHIWALLAPRQGPNGPFEARYDYYYPGLTPWARKTSGALAADGGNQWDLFTFDDGPEGDPTHYWSRLRDLCRYAQERDMLVGISVFFGWVKFHSSVFQEQWKYHPFSVEGGGFLSLAERAMAINVATPTDEMWHTPFNPAWSKQHQVQWHWETYANKLMEATADFNNVFFVFIDEHSVPDGSDEGNCAEHFRQFFQSRGRFWVDWGQRRGTVDAVFDAIWPTDKNSAMVALFNATPARPFLLLESPPMEGEAVREAIWTLSVAGGNYLFHADGPQEHVSMGTAAYDPNVVVPDGLGDDRYGSKKHDWLGHASVFFNRRVADLASLRPLNGPCTGAYCFADLGREYVAYSKNGPASVTVELTAWPEKSFDCYFWDPRTGEVRPEVQVAGGAARSFTKPDTRDWVLHVVERS